MKSLAVCALLLALLLTACTVTVPGNPPLRVCFPAKAMACNPHVRLGLL